MTEKPSTESQIEAATSRVIDLEAELEAAGNATTEGEALARVRAILHQWVDTVTAVVATPGVGRVVLIHDNGRESRIASPDLPFLLAVPVTHGARAGEG
ncbi:hypothetical protein [Novosphingobium album (ex Liu et al. 2023)]|uniref:Histidine kinase n=1 Tax=Novosphingobium album (ex Liu et al. 2023) TaxID=3031130 RepID=A0ABT5WNA5_9SPHN|nr:hypothetical protein [Novosphingobium album (ex Liu et al. 2023)]MDE8650742.1 hypothetical protein [Novosphingobium album (ex Liu et al. 2023)]